MRAGSVRKALFSIFFFILSITLLGQKQPSHLLRTRSSGVMLGDIIEFNKDALRFAVNSDTIAMAKDDVLRIETYVQRKSTLGDVSSDYSTYFTTSPAISLTKGQVAFETVGVSMIRYGATDWLTIEAGTSISAILNEVGLVVFSAKVVIFSRERIGFGTSVTRLTEFSRSGGGSLNYVAGFVTIGNPWENVTLGIGALVNEEIYSPPLYQLGGVKYIGDRHSLIVEGRLMTVPDGNRFTRYFTTAGGVRFRKRYHSWDVMFWVIGEPSEHGIIVGFPLLGYRLDLNRRN